MEFLYNRDKRLKKRYDARNNYWKNVGVLESDVITHIINPAFLGMPAWPDLRQAFKVIRTDNSVIIATDGLSDDFKDEKDENGFGIELFAETNDEKIITFGLAELGKSWLFQLVFQAAANAANSGAYYNAINQHKYVSSEFWDIDINKKFISDSDGVGVILGIERKSTPSTIIFENREILVVSITPLINSELNYIIENGKAGREALVEKLKENNFYNVIDLQRKPQV